MKSIIIIGASGHGKVIADIIQKSGDQIIGFLDDNINLSCTFIGFPVLGTVNDYKKYKFINGAETEFIIAIGNAAIREDISKKLEVHWYTAVHPSAIISEFGVSIGEGTVVMANTVINTDSSIGKQCIINTGAVVEHDNRIEDYVHVSVGVRLAGTVDIGKSTWIGVGASISNNLSICEKCIIGAGAVVVRDITVSGTYVGVPAKRIGMNALKGEIHENINFGKQ